MPVLFVALLLLGVLLVVAIKLLPWWVSLLGFGVVILGLRWGVPWVLQRLFTLPFKAKGQVLRGATLQLHNLRPMATPTLPVDPTGDRPDYSAFHWYELDLSIQPAPTAQSGLTYWEPGDLLLITPATPAMTSDDRCWIHDYQIYQAGQFTGDTEGKYEGSQRLRFQVGVLPTVTTLTVGYYFERFGIIVLPQARDQRALP